MKKSKKKAVPKKKTPKGGGIEPLGDRVLVRPFTEEEVEGKKRYGIILPDSVSKEKSAQGKVLAVGPGRFEDGKLIPVKVRVGDIILFSKYGYDEVEHRGEDLYLLKEDNILAVIR